MTDRACRVCGKVKPLKQFRLMKTRNDYDRWVNVVKIRTSHRRICLWCESLENKAKYQARKARAAHASASH